MKNLQEIINQEPVYMGEFKSKIGVFAEFDYEYYDIDKITQEEKEILLSKNKGINILFAYYDCECWEGEAFVLFERDGKLYEVNGSHCSCYGLEGQWDEEEVSLLTMEHILKKGNKFYFCQESNLKLKEFLGIE